MISCTEVSESIPALVLGALDLYERVEIVAHIDSCPGCRELLHEYAGVSHGLLMAVPQRIPPPGLKKMLMARVATPQPTWLERIRTWLSTRQALPRWSLGAVVAAVLLVVSLVGVQAARLTSQQELLSQQLQQQQATLAILAGSDTVSMVMQGTPAASGASGVIRYSPQQTLAVLHVQNMPALSAAQSYQLWLIDADGKRDSGAVFSVPQGSDGSVTLVVMAPRSFKSYVRCGISLEPRGGSPKPTGPAILTAAYS